MFCFFQRTDEESEPKKSSGQGSPVNLPTPVLEDVEAAESSDSKDTADTRKFVFKFKSYNMCLLSLLSLND